MKKSLKKILFTVLTVFAVFFVVACGNKEDTKINKEEVIKKATEALNNVKSGNNLLKVKAKVKGGATIEYIIIDISLIKEPLTMKVILETKDTKVTIFQKDSMEYINNSKNNNWKKQNITKEHTEQYKNALDDSIKIYKVLKDNLDKVSIKEDGGNYIISVDKNSAFLNEYIKNKMTDMIGQSIDFKANNAILECIISKETYLQKSLVLSLDTEIQGQEMKVSLESILSNINNVEEITVPEEALNSSN